MKRARMQLVAAAALCFALFIIYTFLQVTLQAQALQYDYDTNGVPAANDDDLRL